MPDVAFVFEALEDGARGRFLHGVADGERLAHLLGSGRFPRPEEIHHEVFEFTERLAEFSGRH